LADLSALTKAVAAATRLWPGHVVVATCRRLHPAVGRMRRPRRHRQLAVSARDLRRRDVPLILKPAAVAGERPFFRAHAAWRANQFSPGTAAAIALSVGSASSVDPVIRKTFRLLAASNSPELSGADNDERSGLQPDPLSADRTGHSDKSGPRGHIALAAVTCSGAFSFRAKTNPQPQCGWGFAG